MVLQKVHTSTAGFGGFEHVAHEHWLLVVAVVLIEVVLVVVVVGVVVVVVAVVSRSL